MKKLFSFLLVFALALSFYACGGSSSSDSESTATYSISYDGNGSSSGDEPTDANEYKEGDTVTVVSDTGTLVKPAYGVVSWNTMADGSGTSYKSGDTFVMGSADVTLYAIWDRWTKLIDLSDCGTKTYGEYRIAADSSANIYVSGYITNSENRYQGFVVKYNSSGVQQWINYIGDGSFETAGNGIAVDSGGNCYVSGYTRGDIDGDGSQVLTGSVDLFVVKYNTDGVQQWVKQAGVSGVETDAEGITLDSSGNIYVTGYTFGALDMALDSTLTSSAYSGTQDAFVIKFNSSCEFQWVKLLSMLNAAGTAYYYSFGYDVAVDTSGGVYMTGACSTNYSNKNMKVAYLAKYESNGNSTWINKIGYEGMFTIGVGVCINKSGDACYVGGRTNYTFNGQTVNGKDAFVIKYSTSDTTGTPLWTRMTTDGTESVSIYGYDVDCDSNGNVYLVGDTTNAMNGVSLPGDTTMSCFMTVLDSDGNKVLKDGSTWTRLFGGNSARGVVVDSGDNAYVSGFTSAAAVFDDQTFIGTGNYNMFVTTRAND